MSSAVAKRDETQTAIVTPMEMLDRAISSGANPETLEKLLALQERWEASQAKKAFDEAMATVKSKLPVIIKTKQVSGGGGYGFKHETLTGIAKQIDPILAEYGLSYRFRTSSDATTVTVVCVMSHRLGHSEETSLTGPHDKSGGKNSIQAVGSAVTYLERYSLKAALGMAAADDDDAALVDAGEKVSQEQIAELIQLADEVGADKAKFCKYLKIESFSDLPASRFNSAKQALEAKRKKAS